MAELPQGTVTLLFTDIEGSTRLLNSLGPDYEQVLASHRTLLREAFQSHGGIEVDTQGDAFFYVFSRAQDAITSAIEAQRAVLPMDSERKSASGSYGDHTGEPAVSDEGYIGSDVHLGARICAAAWGGQILLSPTTAAHISSGSGDATLRRLGAHALKDIEERVEVGQDRCFSRPAAMALPRSE